MFRSLQFFNALVVRVKQKPEGFCSVLDILLSLMIPALNVEYGGVLFPAEATSYPGWSATLTLQGLGKGSPSPWNNRP
jgi:hypothetical protein